ncbi:hypothetical protein CA13_00550 [Planctomycetes bacterium CA13]|uniref:Uncharacterized protein n=1 Tax=Novipirellula herctigrandis TaxID=2527986 RepID=A0A5C5YUF5_9BACT|nr:hypothetical protein CA13_73840 [Planctomycetes bacterium CA13]TWT78659.1 hypothetical protein CA13_00550 [Planctomycetes bacterium CA13]
MSQTIALIEKLFDVAKRHAGSVLRTGHVVEKKRTQKRRNTARDQSVGTWKPIEPLQKSAALSHRDHFEQHTTSESKVENPKGSVAASGLLEQRI